MTIPELLDMAKKAQGFSTDMALAKALGVSRSAVSAWRNGQKGPDTVQAAALAGYTGIPLARVLGIVGEARAISREEKAVWRKLAATAMTLLMGVGLALPQHAQAVDGASNGHTVYTLCEVVKKRLVWVLWWLRSLLPSPTPSDTEIEA